YYFLDRVAVVEDRHGPFGVVDVVLRLVDPELVIHRGEDVLRRDGMFFRELGASITFAQYHAALDPPTGHGHGEDVRPVVAARVLVDPRRAAKFAPAQDERVV